MEYIVIPLVALLASALTLLSGFGLGMLLSAALMFFFPLDIAVALTAIVHFANNILKFVLFKKHFIKSIILRFGIPAILCAFIGAWALEFVVHIPPLGSIDFLGKTLLFIPLNMLLGTLMVVFAFWAPHPKRVESDYFLVNGGILSGFFGGLAGHQGGLRSAFLTKLNLNKEAFIACGVAISCMVDIIRISVYGYNGKLNMSAESGDLMLFAVGFAYLGVFLGKKLMEKTTILVIQKIVKTLLTIQGLLIITGIV